jgi:multidrug efflux pump subunit AcrB
MQRGKDARTAGSEAADRAQVPLLGATVIGIMAFSGIGLSPDTTGEFLFSLFAVIGMSLMLSWVLAVTVTPLLGVWLLKEVAGDASSDPYAGPGHRLYGRIVTLGLRARWLVVLGLVAITGSSIAAFGLVKQQFFPNSTTPLFYVHYSLPQGADLRATARDLEAIEELVLAKPEVTAVTTLIGRGASRFMLTYQPEQPDPAYGQLIVRTENLDAIDPLAEELRRDLPERFPDAEIRTERVVFGPPTGASVEARFAGQDPAVLRALGDEARQLMAESGVLRDLRIDWRQRELAVVPVIDEERARVAGVRRDDITQTILFATSGIEAGTFREGDNQIPIIVRAPAFERQGTASLRDRTVFSEGEGVYVPLSQVVERFETRAEEALIHRRDRQRTLSVQGAEIPGLTADAAFREVRPLIEAIELPAGYRLSWGGEYEAAGEAQASLGAQVPLGFLVMLVISILLFGKVRQPLILWLVVPMSVTGMVLGLLLANLPFTFLALLGFLSLSGMLIKNAIVLVDEIDIQRADGKPDAEAIVEASVSRLRPVTLAAGTTILGMLPLLGDAFFASMAVTIMGGLAFASVLTLIAVPTLYAILFRIQGDTPAPAGDLAPA